MIGAGGGGCSTDCVSIGCCQFRRVVVCVCPDPIIPQLRFPFSSGGLVPTFYLRVMEVFWSYLGSSYPPAARQSSHILHRTGKPLSLLFPHTLTPQSLIIPASCLLPHAIPPKRCWPQVAPFFLPGYALSRAPYDPITLSPSFSFLPLLPLFGAIFSKIEPLIFRIFQKISPRDICPTKYCQRSSLIFGILRQISR